MFIETFIKYIKYEKRYSLHTINSYQSDLEKFAEFFNFNNKSFDPLSIGHQDIRKWIVF